MTPEEVDRLCLRTRQAITPEARAYLDVLTPHLTDEAKLPGALGGAGRELGQANAVVIDAAIRFVLKELGHVE